MEWKPAARYLLSSNSYLVRIYVYVLAHGYHVITESLITQQPVVHANYMRIEYACTCVYAFCAWTTAVLGFMFTITVPSIHPKRGAISNIIMKQEAHQPCNTSSSCIQQSLNQRWGFTGPLSLLLRSCSLSIRRSISPASKINHQAER